MDTIVGGGEGTDHFIRIDIGDTTSFDLNALGIISSKVFGIDNDPSDSPDLRCTAHTQFQNSPIEERTIDEVGDGILDENRRSIGMTRRLPSIAHVLPVGGLYEVGGHAVVFVGTGDASSSVGGEGQLRVRVGLGTGRSRGSRGNVRRLGVGEGGARGGVGEEGRGGGGASERGTAPESQPRHASVWVVVDLEMSHVFAGLCSYMVRDEEVVHPRLLISGT